VKLILTFCEYILGLKPLLYLLGLIYKTSNNVEENVSKNFDKKHSIISHLKQKGGLNVQTLGFAGGGQFFPFKL